MRKWGAAWEPGAPDVTCRENTVLCRVICGSDFFRGLLGFFLCCVGELWPSTSLFFSIKGAHLRQIVSAVPGFVLFFW